MIELDGSLELRKIGDEACLLRQVRQRQGAIFDDETACFLETALELAFGLRRDQPVDDQYRRSERAEGEEGERDEDAVRERAERAASALRGFPPRREVDLDGPARGRHRDRA